MCGRVKSENSSLPVTVRVSKTRVLKLPIREFKKTATATATATSLNKRFNEQNNRCARAL